MSIYLFTGLLNPTGVVSLTDELPDWIPNICRLFLFSLKPAILTAEIPSTTAD